MSVESGEFRVREEYIIRKVPSKYILLYKLIELCK